MLEAKEGTVLFVAMVYRVNSPERSILAPDESKQQASAVDREVQ